MTDVYLDYNASAPLDPRVFETMVPVLSGEVPATLPRCTGSGAVRPPS